MDPESLREVLTLVAFVGAVTTAFSLFFSVLIRLGTTYATKKSVPTVSKKEIIILAVGAAGCLCVLYGLVVEPLWLSIEHVKLKSTKLAPGQFVRIAHISSIRTGELAWKEEKRPECASVLVPN